MVNSSETKKKRNQQKRKQRKLCRKRKRQQTEIQDGKENVDSINNIPSSDKNVLNHQSNASVVKFSFRKSVRNRKPSIHVAENIALFNLKDIDSVFDPVYENSSDDASVLIQDTNVAITAEHGNKNLSIQHENLLLHDSPNNDSINI
jgi:hypothetical protein